MSRKGIPKNRMSIEQVRASAASEKMSWHEWEAKIDGALRMNGWVWWRDRVMPKRFGDAAQSVGRKAGLPDRLVAKVFDSPGAVPRDLAPLVGPMPGERCGVTGFIEAKTARAVPTPKQERWLEIARLTPGMFGLVVYPHQYEELVGLLGGERGV